MVGKHPPSLSEKTPVAESIFSSFFWEGVESTTPQLFWLTGSPTPYPYILRFFTAHPPSNHVSSAEYRYFDVELVLPPEQLMGHQGGEGVTGFDP